jgi:hypothetical protein
MNPWVLAYDGFDPRDERLREGFDRKLDHYLKRASHGSTLSGVVNAWVLARSDRPRSWRLFTEALRSDLHDVQGGTTAEGIHLIPRLLRVRVAASDAAPIKVGVKGQVAEIPPGSMREFPL